jgi:aminocarboxymuconate-semialdehyde decarboxylase
MQEDAVVANMVNSLSSDVERTQVIDIHRHCMLKTSRFADRLMEKFLKLRTGWRDYPSRSTVTVDGITSIAYHELNDIDVQMRAQDEAGVSMSVLSFSMELELMSRALSIIPDAILARKVNDGIAAMVTSYPSRLAFMAMINPFNNGSTSECERCLDQLGAKGINISTSWKGKFLDSEKLNPFWEYAQAKDVPIFLHPPCVPIGYQKMNRYRLEEVVGRPFDTTMTVARMIYSGIFDRYPALKVIMPHMGGSLPSVIGRLDFGYRLGYDGLPKIEAAACKFQPSHYLKTNLYVDTMGFSPTGIKQCIELFGTDRILFGTDYPAVNISQKEHVDMIKGLGLSEEDEDKIFWKNAKYLFKLSDANQ